jgi:hypothetical protein
LGKQQKKRENIQLFNDFGRRTQNQNQTQNELASQQVAKKRGTAYSNNFLSVK